MKTYGQLHIFIFITLGVFIFSSCKKELTNNHISTSNTDQKLERQIQSFQKKIFSNLKDGENMEVDSIRWYLESSTNYTFDNGTAKNPIIAVDSFMLMVPVSNNYATLNDVEFAYNTIVGNVTNFYLGLPTTEKQILCIAIKQTSLTENNMQLKVFTTVVYGPIESDWLFQPGQSWMYGDGLGNCNGNFLGQDAATEIERRIMLRKPQLVGTFYYTDPTDVFIDASGYGRPGAPQGNIGYCYMMFENPLWPNFHTCLPYEECNLYLTGTEHVIYTADALGGARPTILNYSFIYLDLYGSVLLNYNWYEHYGTVHYGVLHQKGLPD